MCARRRTREARIRRSERDKRRAREPKCVCVGAAVTIGARVSTVAAAVQKINYGTLVPSSLRVSLRAPHESNDRPRDIERYISARSSASLVPLIYHRLAGKFFSKQSRRGLADPFADPKLTNPVRVHEQ